MNNFTETQAHLPRTDIISITIASNWTSVCQHIHELMSSLCATLSALDCTPLAVGETQCIRGICICLRPSDRRSAHDTTVTASVRHWDLFSNATQWPAWVSSWAVLELPDTPYWVLPITCVFALLGLFAAACVIHTCRRYLGYKKLEHPKGVEPASL